MRSLFMLFVYNNCLLSSYVLNFAHWACKICLLYISRSPMWKYFLTRDLTLICVYAWMRMYKKESKTEAEITITIFCVCAFFHIGTTKRKNQFLSVVVINEIIISHIFLFIYWRCVVIKPVSFIWLSFLPLYQQQCDIYVVYMYWIYRECMVWYHEQLHEKI